MSFLRSESLRNLSCGTSSQSCSSSENISNKIPDENISNCSQFSAITSSIVESKLRNFFHNNVDKEVCQMITDHCNYKLAEIFQASTDYMKKCGRSKFTIQDFEKGVSICVGNPNTPCSVLPSDIRKRKRTPKDDKQLQNICKTEQHIYLKEMWLKHIKPFPASMNKLPVALKKYFKAVTEVVFLSNEEFISVVLRDLQVNKNIFQLVPYFIDFFYDGINKFKCDFIKMTVLLKLINALLRNPYVYFGHNSYLNILACMLLQLVVSDLPLFDQGKDCWSLKESTANIIAFILNKSKSQQLFFEVLYFLQSVLLTFENTLNSHYGALVVLNSIGVLAIVLLLPLYIHKFHEHVILSSDVQKDIDVQMVQGQILQSYHLLVNYYFKYETDKPKFSSAHHFNSNFLPDYLKDIKVFPIISQSFFSDYFGEALLPSFPSLNFVSHSTYLRKKR